MTPKVIWKKQKSVSVCVCERTCFTGPMNLMTIIAEDLFLFLNTQSLLQLKRVFVWCMFKKKNPANM